MLIVVRGEQLILDSSLFNAPIKVSMRQCVRHFHGPTRPLVPALKIRRKGHNWVDEHPRFLLDLGIVPKEDLETSSAELVFGELLTVSGEATNRTTR
ncbi:hypothetical protein RRG08_047684 [Elysia crispata]|uniref:Uncharacterized protein n=1 Tax=Elysia crispata TaxID=231223 RepID=A0AAE1BCR4_9GAST|nr:hypothetical protein RRG08_047684 [Elysia crispata]